MTAPKLLTRAATAIARDPGAAQRHWAEVLEIALAGAASSVPRCRARAEREAEVARRALAAVERGEVVSLVMGEAAAQLGVSY